MGKVQGVKEKLQFPLYDAFFVPGAGQNNNPPAKKFEEAMTDPRVIRFFVDVQNKTKLETNLQAAGVLPSLNTFEARAMRVVVSARDLPRCPNLEDLKVPLKELIENLSYNNLLTKKEAAYTIDHGKWTGSPPQGFCDALHKLCGLARLDASMILAELIYNSVTTLLVGEKIMIETPTFYFPAGAGVSPGNGGVTNHGEPDPMATFRFAEPIILEPQQNFRVEMLFPRGVPGAQGGPPGKLGTVEGPFRIWVMLDGYLTRDVQ
jgi:hypothetical protein